MRKRVLIVGGSYSAIPIGKAAIKRDLDLILVTGKPMEPLSALATAVIESDYSEIDATKKAISDWDFDFIVPSCNDFSYLLAFNVATDRGLPGFDSADAVGIINSKKNFRVFCNINNISSPKRLAKQDLSNENYPLIVKPNYSFSGRGISLVRNPEDLDKYCQNARHESVDGEYTIEEFVEGTLHSVSVFILKGRISKLFFVDEYCVVYPFQVDQSNHPSKLSDIVRTRVVSEVEKIIKFMYLVDGLLHVQFILKNDTPFLIECMRRCPGDLFGNLIQYSTGFDYYDAYINSFTSGSKNNEKVEYLDPLPYARITESSSVERILESFSLNISDNIFFPLVQSGDKVLPAPYGKSGICFVRYLNTEKLFQDSQDYKKHISINEQ